MTIQRTFNYTEPTITAQAVDDSGQSLWLAFSQDVEGNCVLKKVSAFDPSQVFFSIDIAVSRINRIIVFGTSLYLAYNDTDLLGAKYTLSNPLLTHTDFDRPVGINENPVDVVATGSDLFYLLPGDSSGENAKVINLTTSGTFVETIDLLKSGNIVTNAKSIAVDTSDNLWIITYTSPTNLVRVYEVLSVWDFTITQMGT